MNGSNVLPAGRPMGAAASPPRALRDLRAWVVWKLVKAPGDKKPRKVPCYAAGPRRGGPRFGTHGAPADRAGLASYDEACAYASAQGFAGVGFATLPDWKVVALDFDDCVVDGRVNSAVFDLVMGTYCETSPSGQGVRAFMSGELPIGWSDKKANGTEWPFKLETFHRKGFVTFTGHALPECELIFGTDHVAPLSDAVLKVCEERWGLTSLTSEEQSAREPRGVSVEHLRVLLRVIAKKHAVDPLWPGRAAWLNAGMALHHETRAAEWGLNLFDEWSADLREYKDRDDVEKEWHSLGKRKDGPLITLAWLEREAGEEAVRAANATSFEVVTPEESREAAPSIALDFVDFASLAHRQPKPREFVVAPLMPRKALTLLSGAGGAGKSLLAQQAAVCIANGLPFLGFKCIQGPVLGVFCEDDEDELLRRAARMFEAFGLAAGSAARGLHLDGRAGKANIMAVIDRKGVVRGTPFFDALRDACRTIRPSLVTLDNNAQLSTGEGIARPEVTQFCNMLTGLACEFDCAVLLLGHPAKADGSEYAGSTAWDAAVRSRLFLERQNDGTSMLKLAKANYAPLESWRIEYQEGLFVQAPFGSTVATAAVDAARPVIAAGLTTLTARQVSTSHTPAARNNLVRMMAEEGLLGEVKPTVAHTALGAMLDSGELLPNQPLGWRSASRHEVMGLKLATA